MAKIVIIGGGLTGISTAYHLEKRGFSDYTLFEKEETVGGLCRSVTQDGFTFDYTGHLLHTSDPYFRSLINSIFGLDHMNTIHRRSFIYSHDRFTRYPYQVNLFGLPHDVIADCVEGFVNRNKSTKQAPSFPEWVEQNFGNGFAKNFFLPFQEKLFSYNLNDITSSWTGRFVPKTSLKEMILGALSDRHDDSFGYNAHFYYPKRGGIQSWILKLAAAIKKPMHTGYAAQKINLKNRIITFANGHEESFDILINTMPLDTFIHSLKEKPTTIFKSALKNLACNSVINFNLGINRDDLTEKHWIYFPENQYPFYRIGFPHNFAQTMAPEGCSSLYGEFSHINKSPAKVKALLKQAITQTKKILSVSDQDIITKKVISISHAYVIYNFWREHNLPKLHQRLQEDNIYSVGRYGEWKYSSMQEAVLDGKKIAEKITIMPAKKAIYQKQKPTPSWQKEM